MDKSSSHSEKIWLVRSSTRVLGPFDLDAVMQLLSTKQISIIDEIRQPDGRWSYIRENEVFLELIRHLRNEQDDAVENTVTTTQSSHTFTKSGDVLPLDDLTPTPIIRSEDLAHSMKDIVRAKEVTSPGNQARAFGMVHDDRVQRIIQARAGRWRWGLLASSVAIAVLAGFLFLRQGHRKENSSENLAKEALRYKSMGLYEKALTSYKRLGAMKDPEAELQFQMAPLLISEDRQSLLGRRILERSILQPGRSRGEMMEAHIGVALTYLQEGDLKEAESYLQKALTFEPSNIDARTDLAIIQIKKGNLTEASQNLEILSKRSPSAFLTALRAMVEIEKARENPNLPSLHEVFQNVQDEIKKSNYLRQELSFLGLNLSILMNDKRLKDGALLNFLDQAPFQSSRFRKNPLVDWRILQWDYIEKFCAEVFRPEKMDALEKGARAICLMEVDRDQDAFRLLSEARGESPKEPRLMALEAAYLMKTDRQREAGALLKMIPNGGDFLTLHLNANLCQQQGTLDCAETFFQRMASALPSDVESFYGLAWVAFERSQRAQAYDKVRVGLQLEPNYLPLLDLRNRMEEE